MSYVIAGYSVTILAIGGYALWLTVRLRQRRDPQGRR